LAQVFDGEIINCDSLQVYRHFDVGTAKLAEGERRGIPHHLIDIANPDEVFTAGEFARRARICLTEMSSRQKLPLVAGGTGFYLRALIDGLVAGPERDVALRERLAGREQRRPGSLHRLLRRFDAQAARRIHAHDVPKVMRALEICLWARQPATELFATGRDALQGHRVLKLGLWPNREELYRRLDERCEAMFAGGLEQEVRHILELGFAESAKPFESHGYKQTLQMIHGELTPKEALWYAQRNTRRYAKRQMTWFRQEREIQWLHGFGGEPEIERAAEDRVRNFLTDCPQKPSEHS
jgi:tRNA dimethylallyltransferase